MRTLLPEKQTYIETNKQTSLVWLYRKAGETLSAHLRNLDKQAFCLDLNWVFIIYFNVLNDVLYLHDLIHQTPITHVHGLQQGYLAESLQGPQLLKASSNILGRWGGAAHIGETLLYVTEYKKSIIFYFLFCCIES